MQAHSTIPLGFCQCGCGQKTKLALWNSDRLGWVKGQPIAYINNHHWRGRSRVGQKSCVPIEKRFWAKVIQGPDCWLWTGGTNGLGYGRIDGQYAHRLSYTWSYGPIRDGLDICHHCDNPRCVRPDHLFAGTAAENTADMVKKGRLCVSPSLGEQHGMAKLTNAIVLAIRAQAPTTRAEYTVLGRQYGVDWTTIGKITRRASWRHI